MRFKKGSKVEVMNKEVPASWRVAEIISGNGHTYNLRFDGCQGVEKVSRKFVRPCLPAIGSQSWATGDIVEVFDENTWKMATVSRVFCRRRLLVRPHGFTHEIIVDKMNVRVRQSLRDGQWIPVGKISGSYGDVRYGKAIKVSSLADSKIHQQEDDCLPVYNDARLHESRFAASKKRDSPFCSSLLEASPAKPKKFKASEEESHSLEKVDAFAHMQPNFKNSLNGYYETEKRKKTNGVACTLASISEPYESVGSCSVPSDGPNILSSDAESFNTPQDEEEAEVSIHRLELNAYCSTLEALYASDPLSWEKEELLTNLRINLHISNDEHLIELRHLISPGACVLG